MASRKRAKPSFDVPEELRSAPQGGWVYRSGDETGDAPAPLRQPLVEGGAPSAAESADKAGSAAAPSPGPAVAAAPAGGEPAEAGIMDLAARTISSGLATVGNMWLLAARILTSPFSMGMKILGRK